METCRALRVEDDAAQGAVSRERRYATRKCRSSSWPETGAAGMIHATTERLRCRAGSGPLARECRMTTVIRTVDLPAAGGAARFEGGPHGADLSFFLVDSAPGQGPGPHSHPYGEVFVVRAGCVRFEVGGKAIDAAGGDIVVVPGEIPHAFVNQGPGRLEMLSVHASGSMITRWLDDLV